MTGGGLQVDFSPPLALAHDLGTKTQASSSVEMSVVIPVYGAAPCLRPLHERLTAVLTALVESYEIVFIEDCSPDNSWETLISLARADNHVKAFKLSRNFGQQMAITAGLAQCKGDWAVVMDCDLQDAPEDIVRLYEEARRGHQIVMARRKRRKHSAFRKFFARAYFRLVNIFSNSKFNGEYGSFSIISRAVIDSFLSFSDRNRHYQMIIAWLGFDATEIEYEQDERYAGSSSYSLPALVRLAVQGMFFQTTILLQLIIWLGFLVSLAGVAMAAVVVANYMMHSHTVPSGWSSIILVLLLLGGCILVSLGTVGLYIGEIFDQVKQRPLYVIACKAPHSAPDASE